MLLRGAEQEFGGAAFEQKAKPESFKPGIPSEDGGRLPVGDTEGVLVEIEGMAQGAGGALVCGEDGRVGLERLLNLRGQRARIIHTPFIRFVAAEKVVMQQVSKSAS